VDALRHYCEVWAVDFEFAAPSGERPTPLCVVARELRSGRLLRLWLADCEVPKCPPYRAGPETLFVAYYASAELGCHLALDWPLPDRILDLFAEFRCRTSGLVVPCGHGLLGALAYFGLPALNAAEKESLRQLAIRGGPYSDAERSALLDYCQSDVDALARLLPAMLPGIDVPRALLRGRYMAAAARIEWRGVPLDVTTLNRLRCDWDQIKGRLIDSLDSAGEIYVPAGIDSATPAGSAVLGAAAEWGVDPQQLADAVGYLWEQDRAATTDRAAAIRAARRETGLTVRRASLWEDAGRDYSTWPGLDVQARELAGEYPDLGIGPGYVAEESADCDPDYARLLWHRLREPDPTAGRKYSPERVRRAAELLSGTPDAARSGCPRSFSATHFAGYLARHGIPWPRLDSGALALDDDTFREMARAHPDTIGPVRELRHALGQLRLSELAVGRDGRNRCLLSAFGSRTGRNQPSNSRFIFGPSTWLRSLIRPEAGRAVAYLDWSQQELGIAAALSGDPAMQEAYTSGDFYLTFAKLAGAVPADATKATHGPERDQFKTVALGVLYGLSSDGLARKLGVPPCRGRELLRLHQQTFRRFWDWSQAQLDLAMLTGELRTVFGWAVHVGPDANPRSLINFPMQANGAEMMRLAACLATERGIGVCAPVHDAFLIEAAADEIKADAIWMQEAMREASELVLPSFPLRSEVKVVLHPDRYADPRGERFWGLIRGLLDGDATCSAGARGGGAPALPPPPLILSLPM
jgi:hypothetical protein